jgi:putative membrane protein
MLATIASALPFADGHWHDWGPWFLFVPLFWGLVVFALFRFGRAWGPRREHRPRGDSALEILDRRFAKGEIDLEEYRDRRSELEAHEHF